MNTVYLYQKNRFTIVFLDIIKLIRVKVADAAADISNLR